MSPRDLPPLWRSDAETLTRYGADAMAKVCRDHADALDAALQAVADETLDLSTAAQVSGYSVDRLRHMVADGTISNAGARGRPRIRRADLPMKPRAHGNGFDAASAARDVLAISSRRVS